MQTIFRVQSSANINGRIKENCYVFDFAPDRTLKVLAEAVKASTKAGTTSRGDRESMQDLLNFCPVISVAGSRMLTYDVNDMLQQLKNVYIDRVVRNGFEDNNLFNNELLKLNDIDMSRFEHLKKIIKAGNTKSENIGDIVINAQGLDGENAASDSPKSEKPKHELTPEEQEALEQNREAKKKRDAARDTLKAIAIRIPLMIYGANIEISKDIDIQTFIDNIDQTSWEEFMPANLPKEDFKFFAKYFDMDIFIGAGNKIRNDVKYADSLDPENRVRFITKMFAGFKNPDKETVLTPWRMVNMHLGDCIGGYSFYDKNYNEIPSDQESPRFIDLPNITQDIFGKEDTKLLEINSKTGLYPLYLAYTLWRLHCEKAGIDTKELAEDTKQREKSLKIWDEVVQKNIFVICKTQMAKTITQRTLFGYRSGLKINAHAFENLITMLKDGKDRQFREKVMQGKTFNAQNKEVNMKFEAVVGNPPYQISDGGAQASAKPIYHLFIEHAIGLNPHYLSMITPSRWMTGGKGLDNFRDAMLHDKRVAILHDFANSNECFSGVDIKGGVNYFLWSKQHNDKTNVYRHNVNGVSETSRFLVEGNDDIFIRENTLVSIKNKVHQLKEKTMDLIASPAKLYGLRGDAIKSREKYKLPPMSDKPIKDGYKLLGLDDKLKRIWKYLKHDYPFQKNPGLNKYKIFISESYGCGEIGEIPATPVLATPVLATPGELCTETFLQIGPFENKEEMKNCFNYIKTKLFRALVGIKKQTQHATRTVYSFVPLQDFTDKSDIDWSKPVSDIDKQLYKKYGLTQEEITFIESSIKPME